MINIVSARGSYSHHLSNLLAVGTNLTPVDKFFELSSMGDSHSIRDHPAVSSAVSHMHFKHLFMPPVFGEKFVIIEPDRNHVLDYIDNSFSKESNYRFDDWFDERMINREKIPQSYFAELIEFLKTNEIWTADARTLAPKNQLWMIREFVSYKIDQLMFSCYERYFMLTYKSKIKSTDFFDNFESSFSELVASLGLQLKMPMFKVVEHNNIFVKKQKFHDIQRHCDRYVHAVINGNTVQNPCITIFDEAYVQAQLRHNGWEIKIDNLNRFPDSKSLSRLIYSADLKG